MRTESGFFLSKTRNKTHITIPTSTQPRIPAFNNIRADMIETTDELSGMSGENGHNNNFWELCREMTLYLLKAPRSGMVTYQAYSKS